MADTPGLGPLTISDRYVKAKHALNDPTIEKPLAEVCEGPKAAAVCIAKVVEKLPAEVPCEEAVCRLVDKCTADGFQKLVDFFKKGSQSPISVASQVLIHFLLMELSKPEPTEELEALGWGVEPGKSPSASPLIGIVAQFVDWSRDSCEASEPNPIPYTSDPKCLIMHLMVYAALIAQDIWAATFARKLYFEHADIARRGIEGDKDSETIAFDFIKDGPTGHLNWRECKLVMGHIESLLDYGNEHPAKRRRRNAVDKR